MRLLELNQGSPEWLLWRKTGIGSSDAPVIVNGTHFSRTREDLWKEKLGRAEPRTFTPWQNQRMQRGQILEGDARAWYAHFTQMEVEPICAVHPYLDWCKGSLDGYIHKTRTILEIKCPNKKDHWNALEQRVPEKYIPQLNHLILVTGAITAHYLSYYPDTSRNERYALVSHYPDPKVLADLMRKEEVFWNCIQNEEVPHDHLFV